MKFYKHEVHNGHEAKKPLKHKTFVYPVSFVAKNIFTGDL